MAPNEQSSVRRYTVAASVVDSGDDGYSLAVAAAATATLVAAPQTVGPAARRHPVPIITASRP